MLRWPLKLVPKAAVLPIMLGPTRGFRWVVGASIHGCWLGIYESSKQKRFAAAVSRNDVVYDLGAQAGFYSLLASRLVGPQGTVYSFEPLPRNVHFLKGHVALNGVTNIKILELAVSSTDGTGFFEDGAGPLQGGLSERGHGKFAWPVWMRCSPRSATCSERRKIDSRGRMRVQWSEDSACDSKPSVFLQSMPLAYECCEFLRLSISN